MLINRNRLTYLAGVLLLLLTACSDSRFGIEESADFNLPGLLDDKQYSLSALRGKVVYLTFWASWCAPCRQEMPFLVELHKRYAAQGFEVLALSEDQKPQDGIEFITPFAVPFLVAYDKDGTVREQYGVEGMPTHFIIDRDGHVRYSHMGFKESDQERITQQVDRLLKAAVKNQRK